ncbi:hypothetical protein EMCRGX_G007016 [Ephydatia muelleri]
MNLSGENAFVGKGAQRAAGTRCHRVPQVATGLQHTLILLDNGCVLSCGKNESGQLGQDKSCLRPGAIDSLETKFITFVACGSSHSLAIDKEGSLFAWGDNYHGQLGLGSTEQNHPIPKLVKLKPRVVQVAAGGSHTIALLQDGRVFSWGQNSYGQLGTIGKSSNVPQLMADFEGVPLIFIAAGTNHSIALTCSGLVFGWGRNNKGQLGLGHENDVYKPTELPALRAQNIINVACGEEHTVFLTMDGGVFVCGSNTQGQLGLPSAHQCVHPIRVQDLMGSTVIQIACGRFHTLVLVDGSGLVGKRRLVNAFGQGSVGQLGNGHTVSSRVPGEVLVNQASAVSMGDGSLGTSVDLEFGVKRIFAGGDQSFASVEPLVEGRPPAPYDSRVQVPSSLPTYLNHQFVKQVVETNCLELPRIAELVFHSASCVNGSFLAPRNHMDSNEASSGVDLDSIRQTLDTLKQYFAGERMGEKAQYWLEYTLSNYTTASLLTHECLRIVYVYPLFVPLKMTALNGIRYFLKAFLDLPPNFKTVLGNWLFNSPYDYITHWLEVAKLNLTRCLQYNSRKYPYPIPHGVERQPVGRRNAPYTVNISPGYPVQPPVAMGMSPPAMGRQSSYEAAQHGLFQRLTPNTFNVPDVSLAQADDSGTELFYGLHFIVQIHQWNKEHNDIIPYTAFYVNAITEFIDLRMDFVGWINDEQQSPQFPRVLSFCRFPFLLDPQAKSALMQVESRVQMAIAVDQALKRNLHSLLTQSHLVDPTPQSFELNVKRETLIKDTLTTLVTTSKLCPYDFKKPLKVTFIGEEGLDAGGVQKEFFMLLLQAILNPDFGMFIEDPESHLIWFRDQELLYESIDYYVLIGILCGLAIYNSVIVELPFPTALYKKLLQRPVNLSDLKELKPSVGQSLEDIEQYQGSDFEDNFVLNFGITRFSFGTAETVELIPGGLDKPVTSENCKDYVAAYVNYVLNSSVDEPFRAFANGFMNVCSGKVLGMFHPTELMTLVVGNKVVDWTEMEKHMDYRNGYYTEHHTIRIFWKVFYDLPTEAKKKFLVFYTGCNRVPVTGFKNMHMVIQKMDGGPGCERLPVAHTCYNILDLPPYSSEAKLKEKLLQAINFTSGFGIV